MGIYILLYSLLFLCIFFDAKRIKGIDRTYIVYFFVIVFTLFNGLRWETGTDWENYYNIFYGAEWDNVFRYYLNSNITIEYGYVLINLIVKKLTGHYTFFLLISNFFILYTYAQFSLKYSTSPILCFSALLTSTNFFPVRQHIAIAVVMYAFTSILNKSFLKFVLFVFIASTIHRAAIIFLPFYFIGKYNWSFIGYCLVLTGSLLITNILPQVMLGVLSNILFVGDSSMTKLSRYAGEIKKNLSGFGRSYINVVFNFIFFCAYYLIIKVKKKTEGKNNLVFFLNAFVVMSVFQNVFASMMQELARVANFFLFGGPVLMGELLSLGKKSRFKSWWFAFFGMLLLLLFYRLYKTLHNYPELHFPYNSILFYL